jgi:phage shock protein E
VKRILVLVTFMGLAACGQEPPERPLAAQPPAVSDEAASGEAASGEAASGETAAFEVGEQRRVVYVDVRRPDEWAAGRVEGAIHIPHTELSARLNELEEHRAAEIVLYCRTGRRSGIAEAILREAGFERLHNGGGLGDLARQGLPIVR